jgi:aryl-alcohol dehydrogenase-like predicted oxidoreductase
MKFRKLGNSGLSVSNLTLGTMGFGTKTPEVEAFSIIDTFLAVGPTALGAYGNHRRQKVR